MRYYDGNGREIKRTTAHYVDASGSSSWQVQPAKYYVRSSVLGNEVVSEVWANGRKKKTFVRAAGAQIAYQSAYYSENSPLHPSVVFEYSDASGMSQRSTDKSGAAIATGDDELFELVRTKRDRMPFPISVSALRQSEFVGKLLR